MIRKCTFILAILLSVSLPGGLFAQSQLVLTLSSSVDMALEQNPEFKIAQKELAKARADVKGAYSGILPQMDFYANYQHNWKIQETTIPNFIKTMLGPAAPPDMPDYVQISFGLENTLVYGGTIRQPLFLGGAGIAGIQAARSARNVMSYNLEARRQELIYQTTDAFYTCILARELVEVQEEALVQAKANLENVLKKYEVGMASGFDKMRAEVREANLQPELISARNNYQLAHTRLKAILGLEREAQIKVEGEFAYSEEEYSNYSVKELQDIALQNRAEMKMLAAQKNIARNSVVIARSNFLPRLYFTTDYSWLAMRNDHQFRRDDFSEGFYSGVQLQIPIFHGFQSVQQYQKARLDDRIVDDSEKQSRDYIVAQVEVAFNNFRESKEKYLSARETVVLAQEALRLANLMYEEGSNTQLDVLISQVEFNQAQMNYASTLYEYQKSRYQLRKALGNLSGIIS